MFANKAAVALVVSVFVVPVPGVTLGSGPSLKRALESAASTAGAAGGVGPEAPETAAGASLPRPATSAAGAPSSLLATAARHGGLGSRAAAAWADNETAEMEASVAAARADTSPPIEPNVSDYVWYRDLYATDADNALEHLSFTSPAVQPSADLQAADDARNQAAIDALMPRITAEADEAERYYAEDYPYQENNDLDAFTRTRDYGGASANSSSGTD